MLQELHTFLIHPFPNRDKNLTKLIITKKCHLVVDRGVPGGLKMYGVDLVTATGTLCASLDQRPSLFSQLVVTIFSFGSDLDNIG